MDNREIKLQKKLSLINVWSLAFGCIIGWGAFVMPGESFLPKAGPLGTAIGMGIAALVMILIAYNYQYMVNKCPLAGGEFAYAQDAFGKTHGFVCAWFLVLSYATLVPMNATALALLGRNLLGNVFQRGFHYSIAGYDVYFGELFLAQGILVIFAFLSIRGARFASIFQVILTAVLVIGVLVLGIATVVSPEVELVKCEPMFYPQKSRISGIVSVLSIAPWAYVGFDTVPQLVEEFNFSPKKARIIMIASIIFAGIVYVILNTVTAAVIPDGYANWVEYIEDLPILEGLETLPTFHAAYQLLGNVGICFLGIAVCAAILSGIIGFYMATSRLLYAMSKAKIIPKWFGQLHRKYQTPKNAIVFHLIVSLIAPFFGRNVLGWLVEMASLGATIGYGYTSAAAFKYARKEHNRCVMITGIIGVVVSLVFAGMLLLPIPGLDCSLGKESYICFIAWIILGMILRFKLK